MSIDVSAAAAAAASVLIHGQYFPGEDATWCCAMDGRTSGRMMNSVPLARHRFITRGGVTTSKEEEEDQHFFFSPSSRLLFSANDDTSAMR